LKKVGNFKFKRERKRKTKIKKMRRNLWSSGKSEMMS